MRFIFYIILFSSLIISACDNSVKKQPETHKQTEIANVSQLKNEVVKAIVEEINPKDSLFIVTEYIVGICGNDEQFNGELSANELEADRKAQIEYIKQNPYYIENPTEFKTLYQFNDKTIFCGSVFQNTFENDSITFRINKTNKLLYDFYFSKIKKDTVEAVYSKYSNKDTAEYSITMIHQDSVWVKL